VRTSWLKLGGGRGGLSGKPSSRRLSVFPRIGARRRYLRLGRIEEGEIARVKRYAVCDGVGHIVKPIANPLGGIREKRRGSKAFGG